jgi:hypothetical protein
VSFTPLIMISVSSCMAVSWVPLGECPTSDSYRE